MRLDEKQRGNKMAKIEIPKWKEYLPWKKTRYKIADGEKEYDFIRQWVAAKEIKKIANLDFWIKVTKLFPDMPKENREVIYTVEKGRDIYYVKW